MTSRQCFDLILANSHCSKSHSAPRPNSLKEDLQVSYNTVKSWLETLERLYLSFSLQPFTQKLPRSIHHLWDWSQVQDEGARFENLVASHLWKATQLWLDLGFGNFNLNFIRDRDRREVDFCITLDGKLWLLLEAKLSETKISETLFYFSQKLQVPGIQLVRQSKVLQEKERIRVISAHRWLSLLP